MALFLCHTIIQICLLVLLIQNQLQISKADSDSEINLTFMLIASFGEFGFDSSGAIPAANVALEDINEDNSILPGYRLVYDKARNSKCHRGHSLDAFFDAIESEVQFISIVGCGCSPATEPVAEISHQWNISQISFATGSSSLSDRNRFKRYFRNSLTYELLAPALHSLLDHFGWRRLAVLTQDENLFTGTEFIFVRELRPANITVESRLFKSDDEDPVTSVPDFFVESEDYRVFYLNSYSGPARKIICEAIRKNITYPKYAWIMFDWYPKNWWKQLNSSNVTCTEDELARFLDRVLTLRRYPEADDVNATTDAGISQKQFVERYENTTDSELDRVYAGIMYDVIWVLALALNNTMTMIRSGDINETSCGNFSGSLVPLEQFNYSNEKVGCLIEWNLQQTSFNGVSGHVRFDESGTRIYPRVTLKQHVHQGKFSVTKKRVAYLEHNATTDTVVFTFEDGVTNEDIFPDGIPSDGTPNVITQTFKTGLVVVFDTLAVIGLIFSTICLIFNIAFRNRKAVKLSSPNLNYFIIAGAVLMYISIFFYLLPSTQEDIVLAHCIIEHSLFVIGYSLAFGAVLAKIWRVYQVFHNPTPNKKVFQDWHLILISLAITSVSVLMLLLEWTVPMLRGTLSLERNQEIKTDSEITTLGVREEYYVLVCYEASSPTFFWQIFIFVYLAILQVVGMLLAFQTRRVKIKGLKDSKYVATIIYISSIVLVALALVNFGLRAFINVGTGITVAGIWTLTTIILMLNFVPKMVLLYRDPEGETVGTSKPTVRNSSAGMDNTNSQVYPAEWEEKVASLEKALRERDAKIAALMTATNIGTDKPEDSVPSCEN